MIDQVIGNFRVLSLLGSGGMGDVYLAEHQGIQTRVAIKILHAQISRDADHVQRFFNEARIVGKIKHAGIVKIFDVGFHTERAYLVMELLEGESLAARVQRGRLGLIECLDIAYQLASILAATHAAGIVHRDLKPDNIHLVTDAELGARARVKVLDFGIAKLGGTLSGGPKTIGTMGTPAYMAPEQWGDAGSVDWRADVYSIGCVVFEMLTGRPPFASSTITEAFRNHTQTPPPSARDLISELPIAFDELVTRLLAKHPPERAESTIALAQAFDMLRVSIDPEAQWTTTSSIMQPRATAVARLTEARAATTLGASSGQVVVPARARKKLFYAGAFAAIIVAIAATTIAVYGGGGDSRPSTSAASQPEPPPPTPPPHNPVKAAPAAAPVVEPVVTPLPVVPTKAKPSPAVKHLPTPTPAPVKPATPAPSMPAPRSELEDRT